MFRRREGIPITLARPERTRVGFGRLGEVDAEIELPRRPAVLPSLIVAAMFLVFAGVLVFVARQIHPGSVRTIGDLVGLLFHLFWLVGWSLGVAVLGALTVLLWFYRESFYVDGGRLVTVSEIGPLRMRAEYDLAKVGNVRVEPQNEGARVTFAYGEGTRSIGDALPQALAQKIAGVIAAAVPASGVPVLQRPAAPAPAPEAGPRKAQAGESEESEPLSPAAMVALVAANLVPLAGVLFAGWRLDQVLVLFWAESAVVAFYTLAKMAVVGRWLAIPAGLFFLAHFGAFMAIHFLFIYELFVRGIGAAGREPGAYQVLADVFMPLWPALLALFLSHGVSFAMNFLGRKEHQGLTLASLMAAPYKRVMVMQFTLIFGGWVVMLLRDPRAALVLLVLLKIGTDFHAHRRERDRVP